MIDLGEKEAFTAGQTYVALSRYIDMQALYFVILIKIKDIIINWKIPRLIEIQNKIKD